MTNEIETKLAALGLNLPQATAPVANYVPYALCGSQLLISGQLPMLDGKPQAIGKLGKDLTIEQGQSAARLCGLNILSQVKAAVKGDWSKVKRCLRLGVFVHCTPDFTDQPKVANGVSDLMVELFGERGKHARAAVGVAQLPLGVCVEVEALFEIS